MRAVAPLAVGELLRAPARTVLRVLILAAAVALLASVLLFVGHSLRTMTSSAVGGVPLDWQGPVATEKAARRIATHVASEPGIRRAVPAATAPFAGVTHDAPQLGSIRAGAGSLLAVPIGYRLPTIRYLRGSLTSTGIVLDQQLAATLQAGPGDTVVLAPRSGAKPIRLRVSGIAIVSAADQLFQPLNPLLGPAPAQPPANVAILPLQLFANTVAPELPSIPSGSGASAVPGAQTGTQWQVQAQIDPAALRGSPAAALRRAGQLRNRVERSLPGQVVFVDNLSDQLTTAAGDALYAETLYIMLAVPGALVALGLAYLAALGTADRDRRTLALLRARGASGRDLVVLAAAESVVLGLLAGLGGTAIALAAVDRTGISGGISGTRILAALCICVGVATAGAAAARVGAGMTASRGNLADRRQSVAVTGRPLWQRLYLDVGALAVSGLVYWLTLRTGFSAVVNPDSNPTLSLSIYMFLAPALLWIGAALLLLRLRGRFIEWVTRRVSRGRAASHTELLVASVGRRGASINRGLLVLALLLAFAVNLGIFTATYDQQTRVDAQLTLGADIVASAPAGVVDRRRLLPRIAALPGVAGVAAVDHSYAYVGPDLQDTFGIDPTTLPGATSLRDSYFLGGTATQMLARLHARHDGILVSKETITDYSLNVGDLLRLRVLDHSTGRFRVAPFHVVGIVQEFPSAPKDSFMVANSLYLRSVGHEPGTNVVFAKASGDPAAVAHRIASATRQFGVTVRDIGHQQAQTVTSITSVSLRGISRIEGIFVGLLAAAATVLFVLVGFAERRLEFATMASLGASFRRISAFVWSEAVLVLGASLALASLLGWMLAEMLVAMLQHAFDPPPDHLAVPWMFFAWITAAAVTGTALAVILAALQLRRLPLGAILREE